MIARFRTWLDSVFRAMPADAAVTETHRRYAGRAVGWHDLDMVEDVAAMIAAYERDVMGKEA